MTALVEASGVRSCPNSAAVLPGDVPPSGIAGDDARSPPPGARAEPAVRFRPLRSARAHDPDRPGALADRSGELPPRLVPFPLPGRALRPGSGQGGHAFPGTAARSSNPISRASSWNSRAGRWRRSPSGGTIGTPGARPADSCPRRGLPGLRRARGAAWLEMPDRIQWTDSAGDTRSGFRSSRRSARSSTTSSIDSSGAISRSLRPSRCPGRCPAHQRPPPEPTRGTEGSPGHPGPD